MSQKTSRIDHFSWMNCNRLIGGILLVSGTCIGAGMLGLPIKTAASGFYPSLWAFLTTWLVMVFSALCMLEVSLWFKGEANLITMSRDTLGKFGSAIAGITYLCFLYSLMAAYTSGGAVMCKQGLLTFYENLSPTFSMAIFVLPFAIVVALGAKWVDYVNRIILVGLVVAYITLIWFVRHYGANFPLPAAQPQFLPLALPLIVTAFGFHLLIPSLKNYLLEDIRQLRIAIIVGSALPLMVYILWEWVILSSTPTWGPVGLVHMLQSSNNALEELFQGYTGKGHFALVVSAFAFCALASSFIGVSLGLLDFLADGLKIKKSGFNSLGLALLTFLPPVLYTVFYPEGFLLALGYGSIFAALLLIIYPALMAWRGRTRYAQNSYFKTKKATSVFILLLIVGFLVIILEICSQIKILPWPVP